MNHLSPAAPRVLPLVGLFLLGTALFAVAYGQAPLYYSNQNQYFLHGLAHAGLGSLNEDWLANTADPTPLFSALVAVTGRWLHPWAFHVYQALLLGVYGAALVGLFLWIVGEDAKPQAGRWLVFVVLVVAIHSALARWLSYRLFQQDYPWYLQSGVAGQYLLGGMLQPSVFGVLLLLAIALFVWDRIFLAAACAVLGATIHSTYLLPAALLTAGFLTALVSEGQYRRALVLAALSLALVLPVTVYVLLTFRPASPETFAESQGILVHLRIPHHCLPRLWFDPVAGLQIAWMVLSLALVWGTRLFPVLTVPFVLATLLTLAQVATDSDTLALLFPWRISAVLMPVATTVILSRLVSLRFLPLGGAVASLASAVVLVALAAAGLWIVIDRQAFRSNDEELAMMDFVRDHSGPGEVYLLPVRVPDLAKASYGSLSSDFKPPAAKRQDVRIIPVDLQRFRLHTGAPIFVDFKSIPYKDVDVIEWRDRLHQAENVLRQLREGERSAALAELRRHGMTHLVVPADLPLEGPGFERLYADSSYQVYRLGALPRGG
jgi:hypothetical protein